MIHDEATGRPIALHRLFLIFLRFGALAFGGPIAQIAMVRHALVDERRWVSSQYFNRLLAVMQALPGPEAHELCVHLGMIARGRIGGLLAGLGFMLPGLLLMLACCWAYAAFIAGRPELAGILLGVQVAVLAVILRSIQKIGRHIVTGWSLGAIAVAAAAATLAGVPFWIPLIAGGAAHALGLRPFTAAALVAGVSLIGWLILPEVAIAPRIDPAAVGDAAPLALFLAGLKGGLLTFGGAYTAIPYVRADTVGRGWLSDGAFLDGVALANLLPAPLVIFATFAGFIAGGWTGALAMTAGMFLPAFAFSLIFFERLEAMVEHGRLHAVLDGIAAAAVGIIGATLVELGLAAHARLDQPLLALPIFALALLAAWRLKGTVAAPLAVVFGGIAGWLLLG